MSDPKASKIQQDGPTRTWWATNSSGGGYYVDRSEIEKPMTPEAKVTYDPYSGPGLLAVIAEVGTSQEYRNRAYATLFAEVGVSVGTVFLENASQADPTWNSAVLAVLNGATPEAAFASVQKGQNGLYNDPSFTLDQLTAAKAVADSV